MVVKTVSQSTIPRSLHVRDSSASNGNTAVAVISVSTFCFCTLLYRHMDMLPLVHRCFATVVVAVGATFVAFLLLALLLGRRVLLGIPLAVVNAEYPSQRVHLYPVAHTQYHLQANTSNNFHQITDVSVSVHRRGPRGRRPSVDTNMLHGLMPTMAKYTVS